MQEGRLFKIMYYLLDKGAATAPELAERFEVSVRTIYRDIDALSGAGIPVYTETGRSGGIRLLGDFVLNKTVLSEQERREVLGALQGLSVVTGGYRRDTLEKLSALFRVPSSDWLEVDFSRWGDKPRDNERFELLRDAAIQNRCVRIFYAAAYGGGSERVICPLKLFYKAKAWYLKAYCRKKKDFRLFKLNRILSWTLLEEHFSPMEYPRIEDECNEGACIQDTCVRETAEARGGVTLRFPQELAYRVYDEFDTGQVRTEADGSLTVTAPMPEDEWLIGYLLSFGAQVDIIAPVRLKEIVAARAKDIYLKNKL